MPNNDDNLRESLGACAAAPAKKGAGARVALLAIAAALLVATAGCASASRPLEGGAWLSSYEAARDEARKSGKDVLFFFTGSDWDEAGNAVFAELEKSAFAGKLGGRFVLCRLDIVRDPSLMESGQLETNFLLAGRYAVDGFPFIVLLTPQGDVYGRGAFRPQDGAAAKEALAFISSFDEKRERLVSLKNAIGKSEGVERARLIDAFLAEVDPSQYNDYERLIRSVPQLDPNNESGLKGNYLLQAAWLDAAALLQAGAADEAASRLTDTLADPAMTPALRQDALYLAASVYAAAGTQPKKAVELLEAAAEADPESPNAEIINQIKEGFVLQMKETEAQKD